MAEPVLMPQVGQDIKTATIVDWLKRENDEVAKGEVIATVESDKAAFDVEAYTSGVLLKILHGEGEEVEVLTPIAYIGKPGEEVGDIGQRTDDGAPRAEDDAGVGPQAAMRGSQSQERAAASPSARRLAAEKGVSLDSVTGTGPGGRIVKQDVLAAISQDSAGQEALQPGDTVIPFSAMRARVAARLTRSKQTIPHFYISVDVDMSEAVRRRRQLNEANQTKITITDMVVKAVAMALSEYPRMNSHVEADRVIVKAAANVGVAVSVDEGLIVPVVADADRKSLAQISAVARENAASARAGRMKPQAVGSFTVTNLGTHGIDTFVPVINPPEAAILAVGAVRQRPAVVGDEILARDVMTMTLACDHRAIDGTYAAQFLGKVKQHLENPASLEG
jgi:pyruvate dehydrogenase E2 component (dihydrolipoamide acetyltransferase)